ncbi:Telomerase Cajal body protein 1 [Nowakowskiella sp. JEL0407]|nr:Telomerase Cajal body protein 1 [Nowakowskiella sp. JEL0407]
MEQSGIQTGEEPCVLENLSTEFSEICIKSPEPVHDFSWYPVAEQYYGVSCFITIVRDHPLHLWDANIGLLKQKYAAYDHCDQLWTPNCVEFNLDGSSILCGFENALMIFDTQTGTRTRINTTPTRKSKDGIKGIVSTIAFSGDYSGLFCLGTYSGFCSLHDYRTVSETGALETLYQLEGMGGITYTKFSKDGNYLYFCTRKSGRIRMWDLRKSGEILADIGRSVDTCQRLGFDLIERTESESLLVAGDCDGLLNFFDMREDLEGDRRLFAEKVHHDAVSDVCVHPFANLVATCSGQRHFPEYDDDSDAETTDSVENSIKLWRYQ